MRLVDHRLDNKQELMSLACSDAFGPGHIVGGERGVGDLDGSLIEVGRRAPALEYAESCGDESSARSRFPKRPSAPARSQRCSPGEVLASAAGMECMAVVMCTGVCGVFARAWLWVCVRVCVVCLVCLRVYRCVHGCVYVCTQYAL